MRVARNYYSPRCAAAAPRLWRDPQSAASAAVRPRMHQRTRRAVGRRGLAQSLESWRTGEGGVDGGSKIVEPVFQNCCTNIFRMLHQNFKNVEQHFENVEPQRFFSYLLLRRRWSAAALRGAGASTGGEQGRHRQRQRRCAPRPACRGRGGGTPAGCKGGGAEEGWRRGSRGGCSAAAPRAALGQRRGEGLEARRRGSRAARVGRGRQRRCSLAARAGRVGGYGEDWRSCR